MAYSARCIRSQHERERGINFDLVRCRRIALSLVICILGAGCGDHVHPLAPTTNAPTLFVRAVTPASLAGTVGTAVDPSPAVIVTDSAQHPLAGVPVKFLASFGGTVTGSETLTDTDGIARVGTWIIGLSTSGRYSLTAIAGAAGQARLEFVVSPLPGPPKRLEWVDKPAGTVRPSAVVSVAVGVYDAYNNGVPDVPVHFDIVEGGGTVAYAVAFTQNAGIATLTGWALGNEPGPNAVVARISNDIEQRLTVNTVIEITYKLTAIGGGSSQLPVSQLTIDGKGRFVMSLGGNTAGGTYKRQNTMLLFVYDANTNVFEGTNWSAYPYIGDQKIDADEFGLLIEDQNQINITRCWSEDCYEQTWTYRQIP
jgi:hypothetical protein